MTGVCLTFRDTPSPPPRRPSRRRCTLDDQGHTLERDAHPYHGSTECAHLHAHSFPSSHPPCCLSSPRGTPRHPTQAAQRLLPSACRVHAVGSTLRRARRFTQAFRHFRLQGGGVCSRSTRKRAGVRHDGSEASSEGPGSRRRSPPRAHPPRRHRGCAPNLGCGQSTADLVLPLPVWQVGTRQIRIERLARRPTSTGGLQQYRGLNAPLNKKFLGS